MSALSDASTAVDNPDNKLQWHGMNDSELALAKKFEDIANIRIKEVLEKMGVHGLTREMHVITAKNRAKKQKDIDVFHKYDDSHPYLGGWFFYQGDKLKVVLGHPFIHEGRIQMKIQEFV